MSKKSLVAQYPVSGGKHLQVYALSSGGYQVVDPVYSVYSRAFVTAGKAARYAGALVEEHAVASILKQIKSGENGG